MTKILLVPRSRPGVGTNAGAEPAPNPALAYNPNLYEIEGQSNAAGAANTTDLPPDLIGPMPGVFIYNTLPGAWEKLNTGVNSRGVNGFSATGIVETNVNQHGIEGRLMKLIRDNSTVDKYLIKYAISASGLAADANGDWSVSSTGEYYLRSTGNWISAGRSLGDRRGPRALIWIQGEKDATITASANAYQANLEAFISGKRTAYGNANMAFVIVRLGNGQTSITGTDFNTIRTAQATVAGQSNNYLVDADGLATYDGLHYGEASTETLAQRVYTVLSSNGLV